MTKLTDLIVLGTVGLALAVGGTNMVRGEEIEKRVGKDDKYEFLYRDLMEEKNGVKDGNVVDEGYNPGKLQERDNELLRYVLDKMEEEKSLGRSLLDFRKNVGDKRLVDVRDGELRDFWKCNPLEYEFMFRAYDEKLDFGDLLPSNYGDKLKKFDLDKVSEREVKHFEEMVPWSFVRNEKQKYSEADRQAVFFLKEVYPRLH